MTAHVLLSPPPCAPQQPIGDDYSGEWTQEDSAIQISIIAPASTLSTLPEAIHACEQLPGAAPPTSACYDGVAPVAMLNVSDAYWQQTRVEARGDGFDLDGDGNAGDVLNRAGSNPIPAGVAPRVDGTPGNLGAPSIVAFVADDPNNGDTVYGDGDVLTIVLDRPVDRTEVNAIDQLFSFTTPLGADVRGQWNDTSTFVIYLEDASGAGPVQRGATRVHASVADDAVPLRNRAGCGGAAESSCLMPALPRPPRLVGDFGVLPESPKLLSVTIEDYDNLDSVYSANDTIIVRFDRPTDYGGGSRSGGREFVDALLNFSTPLGNDYVGGWSNDRRDLIVTTLDSGNGTVELQLLLDENGTAVRTPTIVTVVGDVRTREGNSPPSWANLTRTLVGSFGDNSSTAFPRVISSVGREAVRGSEWELTVTLDRATDRGRRRLPEGDCPADAIDAGARLAQSCVELLFTFTPSDALTNPAFPAPATVHGRWADDSVFVMTTTLDVATPEVKFGEGQEDYLQIGATAYMYNHGGSVNATDDCNQLTSQLCQHCDVQPQFTACPYMTQVGKPTAPQLIGFAVNDADNADAVLSVGDEYLLTFDMDTDQVGCNPTCRGGPEYVLRLFAFSAPLASDYIGEWRDNRTFAITVTRVDPGFMAPLVALTIAALRPPNSALQAIIASELAPWLEQTGVSYQDLQAGLVPDALQLRSVDGLSEFASPMCAALSLAYCDDPDTGARPVPTLLGDFGVLAAPTIMSFTGDDPDNFDEMYSVGDTLTLVLNMASDALLPPRSASGDRAFVDELFAFTHSLGADYSGIWADTSTFQITVLDVAGAGTPTMSGPCTQQNRTLAHLPEDDCIFNRLVLPPPMPPLAPGASSHPPTPPSIPGFAPAYVAWPPPVYAFFNDTSNLRGITQRSQLTSEPVALSGSFGVSTPPVLLSWTAADADNADSTFSPGDTLTLLFSMRTNRGGSNGLSDAGGKAWVDTLLEFSASLGRDYSGHWADASQLVIVSVDPTDAAPPRIGLTAVTVRFGEHNITNERGSSVGCMDSMTLLGGFGTHQPPRLVSVSLADEDNGDEVYGYCDTLTFTFDMPTDKASGRVGVHDLFAFSNPRTVNGQSECDVPFAGECPIYDVANGLGYTGAWSADGTSYTLRLQCPAPPGTPTAAVANLYSGAVPPPYLVGNSTQTLQAYELKVARLRLGVTSVRLRADVRNAARNLRPPLLEGEFGSVDGPYIVSYVASNYENADSVYGASDLLTITFDKPTDKAGGERYGLKNYVDALFSFSEGDPADDYSGVRVQPTQTLVPQHPCKDGPWEIPGDSYALALESRGQEWRDDSTFVVRLLDPTDVVPSVEGLVPFSTRPSDLRVSTAGGANLPGALIQNRGVSADRTADPTVVVPVAGNFGVVRSPRLVRFEARDQDNGDDVLSEGDDFLLQFDVATDRGGAPRAFFPEDPYNRASRAEVDRLLVFSGVLGEDYTGLWSDESTLVVSIVNRTGADAEIDATLAIVRNTRGGVIFNAAGNSGAASGTAQLTGSFGTLSAPQISSFVLEDVDNADDVYGEGDALFILWDRATDRGGASAAVRGAEAFVSSLFSFSHPIGSRFSGEWQDASSFVITVVNATGEGIAADGSAALLPGIRATPTAAPGAAIRNKATFTAGGAPLPPATGMSPPLVPRGAGAGTTVAPVLENFVASDPDGGDFTYGVGDELTITFDSRTNQGAHAGGQAFVDSLFLMEPSLGADYSGAWADGVSKAASVPWTPALWSWQGARP